MEYSIRQVSRKMNLPTYTLRYYEKEGLLPSIQRSKGGVRLFSEEDLDWLGLICCLKSTGMPIREIREFVDLSRQGDATLRRRCEMLAKHKQDVEEHIRIMQQQLQKVTMKIQCFTEQYEKYCGR
jgi:DNA-binding transcriptional MerR regulator